MHVSKARGRVQFYLRSDKADKEGIYIPKSERSKIKCYLQKKYDEKVYRLLSAERDNLEKFLKKSNSVTEAIKAVYSENPNEVKENIIPIDISDEDFLVEWMAQPYKGKAIDPNLTVYETNRGEMVRSKSELNIANYLEKLGVPYKYECPLELSNGKVIYPDFTLLNLNKRKIMYWEHRGMMDDKDYANHSVQRIKLMAKNGVILGDNLIITEETKSSPLGTDEIYGVIKKWLL